MPIVIDLTGNPKGILTAFDKTIAATDKLRESNDALNESLKTTQDLAAGAARSFGRAASGAREVRSAAGRMRSPTAPPIQNPKAAMEYARFGLSLDPNDSNALRLYNQAQRKMNAADPSKQLNTALARTRYTLNQAGHLVGMPLGIDLAKFGPGLMGGGLGGGAGAGGLGAIGVAGAALAAVTYAKDKLKDFADNLQRASRALNQISINQAVMGGYFGQSMNLAGAAAAVGSDPASLSSRLQGSISGGGYGTSFATQAGINPTGGPFGNKDYAGNLQKAMRFVANSNSMEEARSKAIGLGVPELANLYNLSPGQKAGIGGGSGLTWGQEQGAIGGTRLEAAGAKFGQEVDKFKKVIEGPFLKGMAIVTEKAANIIEEHNKIVNAGMKEMMRRLRGGKKEDEHQKENTKAVKENTRAMGELRDVFGGGPRARAVPHAIRGNAAVHDSDKLKLGAL